MKPTFFKGVALGAATCFVMLAGTAALAGTGVGDVFNLGQTNTVDAQSVLTGTSPNAELFVRNTGDGRAIFGTTDSTTNTGQGVLGRVTATTPDPAAAGVRGIVTSTGANGYGVWGSHAGSGAGVLGTGALGVLGRHTGTTGTGAGLMGETASTDPNGVGVRAQNTGAGPALNLLVGNVSVPPLTVNSSAKVDKLNADLLDGKHASDFYAAGSKVQDSDKLDGKESSAFQSACVKGSVWAYGFVRGSSSFSTSYKPVYSWNCKSSSGKLEVKRLSTGRYRVLLATGYCLYNPIIVGAVVGDANNFLSYRAPLDSAGCVGPGLNSTVDVTTPNTGGTLQDRDFVLVWLGA
jgi:hypothetical protein